jgi:hypothetical protein
VLYEAFITVMVVRVNIDLIFLKSVCKMNSWKRENVENFPETFYDAALRYLAGIKKVESMVDDVFIGETLY